MLMFQGQLPSKRYLGRVPSVETFRMEPMAPKAGWMGQEVRPTQDHARMFVWPPIRVLTVELFVGHPQCLSLPP